jgi:hypothetical protein
MEVMSGGDLLALSTINQTINAKSAIVIMIMMIQKNAIR